jgi:hypothetical protein
MSAFVPLSGAKRTSDSELYRRDQSGWEHFTGFGRDANCVDATAEPFKYGFRRNCQRNMRDVGGGTRGAGDAPVSVAAD